MLFSVSIGLSVINSLLYWYFCHYTDYNNIKLIFKYLSISLLAVEGYYYMNLIIFCYILGDMVINYDEEKSLQFFGLGHIFFILNILTWKMMLIMIILTPLFYLSTLFFMALIKSYNNNYYLYIYSLQLLLITSLVNQYYGFIPFIISDLLIGLNKYDKLDWPLYYLSILYLNYWFVI